MTEELKPGPAYREWLVKQLEAWPRRVDPHKTTSVTYLMNAAAKALRQPDAVPGDLAGDLGDLTPCTHNERKEVGYFLPLLTHSSTIAAIQSLAAERDAALAMVADLASELESELDAKGIYDTPRKMVRNRQTVVQARALLEGSKP